MASRRQVQVADEIRREIGDLIIKQIKDPRVGFASVTEVRVSPDLRHAHVNVSVYGSEEERQTTLAALQHGAGFFRHEVGNALQLRYTPDITFHLDDSLERGDRILRLLKEVKQGPHAADTAAGPGQERQPGAAREDTE